MRTGAAVAAESVAVAAADDAVVVAAVELPRRASVP